MTSSAEIARHTSSPTLCNISHRLRHFAERQPDAAATIEVAHRDRQGNYSYRAWTFRDLDEESDLLARGLQDMGVDPGMRMVLFVPFSREFIALTFALLKRGAVVVLIDPGMGRGNVFQCLQDVDPDGFVAVPVVHAVRIARRALVPRARRNVTVGRRWFWGGRTYDQLRSASPGRIEVAPTRANDPAAVIFTSGSTGPPKGVLYEHGMFDAQIDMIRDHYAIEPGSVDLAGFPLFGLFDACMGVTTVIPDMDPTRPASVDPERMVRHIRDQQVTQAFGSPAFWNRVSRYCVDEHLTLPTLTRALSAGAPVAVPILQRMSSILASPGADLFTPYGATESLPVTSIARGKSWSKPPSSPGRGVGRASVARFDTSTSASSPSATIPSRPWPRPRSCPRHTSARLSSAAPRSRASTSTVRKPRDSPRSQTARRSGIASETWGTSILRGVCGCVAARLTSCNR